MECPSCGFQNVPGLPRCVRCQSAIDLSAVDVVPPRASGRRARWFTGFFSGTVNRLKSCWARLENRLPHLAILPDAQAVWPVIDLVIPGAGLWRRGNKTAGPLLLLAWAAAVAAAITAGVITAPAWRWWAVAFVLHFVSLATLLRVDWQPLVASVFLPGLGHLLRRRRWGWGLLAWWVAALLLAIVFLGDPMASLFYYLALLAHVLALGAFMAGMLRGWHLTLRLLLGVLLMLILRLALYQPLAGLVGRHAQALSVTGLQPVPATKSHRQVFSDDVLIYDPHPHAAAYTHGDLVVYRLDMFTNHGVYTGQGGYGVDRIVGLPGETVAVRSGVVSVNGAVLPAPEQPLTPLAGVPDFDFTVGANAYGILPSRLPWRAGGGNPDMTRQVFVGASLVARDRVAGKVWYRWRPFSRLGPME